MKKILSVLLAIVFIGCANNLTFSQDKSIQFGNNEVEKMMLQAQKFEEKKEYQKALQIYKKVVAIDTDNILDEVVNEGEFEGVSLTKVGIAKNKIEGLRYKINGDTPYISIFYSTQEEYDIWGYYTWDKAYCVVDYPQHMDFCSWEYLAEQSQKILNQILAPSNSSHDAVLNEIEKRNVGYLKLFQDLVATSSWKGEEGIKQMLREWNRDYKSESIKVFGDTNTFAAYELAKVGDTHSVEPLIAALGNKSGEVRKSVVWALSLINDSRTIGPLIASLKDENYYVRIEAVYALGNKTDTKVIEPLIALLGNSGYYNGRVITAKDAAIQVLSKMGRFVLYPLISALKDTDVLIRAGAARVLCDVDSKPEAVESLIDVLNDQSKGVASSVAIALGEIGDSRAVEPLISVLNDSKYDFYAMANAAEALVKITSAQKTVIPALIKILKDGHRDINIRIVAARVLGEIGPAAKDAVPVLMEVLNSKNTGFKTIAKRALSKIESKNN